MTTNKYLSIITLSVNGLNAPIKRHTIAEWIRKQDPHMLSTRDPPQDKRPTQTEREKLETNFQSKRTGKKSRGSNAHIRQNRLQQRAIKRDPVGHFIILKGRIHQKDINIVNIYAPNIGASKYIRKMLEDFKKDIDSNTIIVRDFNTPLSKMDRSSKQNINKDNVALNNALDEMHLTDI